MTPDWEPGVGLWGQAILVTEAGAEWQGDPANFGRPWRPARPRRGGL